MRELELEYLAFSETVPFMPMRAYCELKLEVARDICMEAYQTKNEALLASILLQVYTIAESCDIPVSPYFLRFLNYFAHSASTG
jgi:hypothetical protein